MNRRILLIDADPAFHASMTKQLARFQFDIVHEADGERAQAMAAAEPPALLVVAVDEPEKAGFKLFQKLRKGATAKVPIMLVTSSMTTESFSKHKALKVHADDYLDKRTQSDELLGKLEQLVGLGDPIEDEMDIPLEVDEIPLAEGDMVLEETIGEDDIQEFDDPHSAGTRNMAVDQLVDAEIDAGFAAMFGDDDAAGVPIAPVREHIHEEVAPAPVADAIHDNASVPIPVNDSGQHDFDSFEEEPARMPSQSRAPVAIDDDVAINSRDMIPIEDLAAAADAEMAADERPESTQVAAPVPDNDAEREFSQNDMVTRAAPVNQKLLEELSIPVAVAHVNRPTGETMAPPISNMAAIDPPTSPPSALASAQQASSKRDSMQPIVDLGLDEIAVRAESEQSGVHDRRSLQKVGELERQIAQLKTELERARSAPAAPASRANDFVNLREQITARDKDLQKAKDELASRDHEIKDALDKARQAQQARTSVETKAQELEQRHTNAQTRIATLEGREKALGGQVAALKDELEARAQAVANAEQGRLQTERDLAAERARAAAGASDAERSLRLEREQLISRHQGELASARGEAEKLRDAALASQKAEHEAEAGKAIAAATEAGKKAAKAEHDKGKIALVATHAGELEALKQQYGQELEALEKEHGDALASARGEVDAKTKEHTSAIAAAIASNETLAKQHADALAKQAQEHAEDLETARAGHAAAVDAHAAELAKLAQAAQQAEAQHATAAEQTAAAHATALAAAERAANDASSGGAQQLAQLRAEHAAALEAKAAEHEAVIEKLAAAKKHEQGAALDKVRGEHAAELDKLRAANAKALEAAAAEHTSTVEELRAQMESARAEAEKALVAKTGDHLSMIEAVKTKQAQALEEARKDHDALAAKHEAAKAEMIEGHRRATEALSSAHAEQLAKLADEKQRAIDDIQKAAADHRQITERAKKEVDAQLAAAQKAADDAAQTHQAEIDGARQAIADQKAAHDKALAAANAEIAKQKSVGDADHKKAMAALVDDHAKTIAEMQREREELSKGLSGARDNAKRLDAELATAVQTIADRNAELRNHVAAIAERDQRLVELRKELDSLEAENASYQEQVLRAYQKIKTDEAMVARAKKAMAIALTVLDDQGNAS